MNHVPQIEDQEAEASVSHSDPCPDQFPQIEGPQSLDPPPKEWVQGARAFLADNPRPD